MEGRPAVISCTHGSAKRVIEILRTLSSKLPTEIIQDSMQQYQAEEADQEHFDTLHKVLVRQGDRAEAEYDADFVKHVIRKKVFGG